MTIQDNWCLAMTDNEKAEVYQFCGLMWATEYNAQQAGLERGLDAQTVNAMNTLLTAFAAFEALITETALCVLPALYEDKSFRRAGLIQKYERFLAETERKDEPVPAVVSEVSNHRIALTHSEPDNERSSQLGAVISATDADRFAKEVRAVADWLWQKKRPGAVAHGFDGPNRFMPNKG